MRKQYFPYTVILLWVWGGAIVFIAKQVPVPVRYRCCQTKGLRLAVGRVGPEYEDERQGFGVPLYLIEPYQTSPCGVSLY